MITPTTLAALELPAVLEEIARRARTPTAAEAARAMRPLAHVPALEAARLGVAEAGRCLDKIGDLVPLDLPDPGPALERLRRGEGSNLDPLEARTVAAWLTAADEALSMLDDAGVEGGGFLERLEPLRDLSQPYSDLLRVITPSGEVEDEASPDLADARRRVRGLRAQLVETLERLAQDVDTERHLQDRFVTVRGERYVVPVRTESRNDFPGILHGTSSTGHTLFVEPMATIELNNNLVAAREGEQQQLRLFLADITSSLRRRLPEVEAAVQVMTETDLDFARARWGRERSASLAEMAGEGEVLLEEARHPLLESSLKALGQTLVPLDVRLESELKVLVISGPNAGGKTVALKTVGVLCLMHQCAIPIPARRARLPTLTSAAIDIGDQQSIAESLSTFSARMRNLVAMAQIKETPMLILLDELGGGTDPMEGGALGIALLEHFRNRGALVVATTHHDMIRAHALSAPGMASAAMEFDADRLLPTFRLRPGLPGVSAGLDLAEHLGLPRRIVKEARRLLGGAGQQAATLLARLRELVEQSERRVDELDQKQHQLEEQRARLDETAQRRESERAAEFEKNLIEALDEIRQQGAKALERLSARERPKARRALERGLGKVAAAARQRRPGRPSEADTLPEAGGEVTVGGSVRVRSLGKQGIVEDVRASGEASVLVGGIRLRVPVGDLVPVEPAVQPARSGWGGGIRSGIPDRLELIGMRVEPALQRLDKFLDDSMLAGHQEVRVIHGSGSGRLRQAVGEFLAEHEQVEEHRLEIERPGGEGVTLVRLRV